MNWADLVHGPPALAPYQHEVPEPTGVRLRSVHADGRGSGVVLRLDLPRFPDRWDGGPGVLGRRLRRHPHPRVPPGLRVSTAPTPGR